MTKNERLVRELKSLVKGLPIDVLGHLEAPALCCRAGTVAVVKIDKGDPARRPSAAKSKRK